MNKQPRFRFSDEVKRDERKRLANTVETIVLVVLLLLAAGFVGWFITDISAAVISYMTPAPAPEAPAFVRGLLEMSPAELEATIAELDAIERGLIELSDEIERDLAR